MIKSQFLLPTIVGINIIGVCMSLLYGRYGGSGGATTEGVFWGIKATGITVVLLAITVSFTHKERFIKKWYFVVLLVVLGLLQTLFQQIIG